MSYILAPTVRRGRAGIILSCLLCTNINAQVVGGTLRGMVSDPTGAVVSGAEVTIKNLATAVTAQVSTDRSGGYSLPSLLPGFYAVTVDAHGFRTQIQSGAEVRVGGVRDVNFSLKLGPRNEQAEVTTAVTTVEPTTAELSGFVGARTITELPLNGRDWTQLATLESGVSSIQTENALGNRVQQGEGQQLTISGGRPWQSNYRLDGISINDYANGALRVPAQQCARCPQLFRPRKAGLSAQPVRRLAWWPVAERPRLPLWRLRRFAPESRGHANFAGSIAGRACRQSRHRQGRYGSVGTGLHHRALSTTEQRPGLAGGYRQVHLLRV
jgi:hypothetical protein